MTVHQLRRYARTVKDLPIFGRQISRANRDDLIRELMQVKFPVTTQNQWLHPQASVDEFSFYADERTSPVPYHARGQLATVAWISVNMRNEFTAEMQMPVVIENSARQRPHMIPKHMTVRFGSGGSLPACRLSGRVTISTLHS
jgi:hypothetical protein